jgi:deoxyribonuclease-4
MAGKGTEVGGKFEQLASIIDKVMLNEKVGVCLDTCHVYDAGYDIAGDLDGVLAEFEPRYRPSSPAGHPHQRQQKPYRSHKDRHEKIGEGSLASVC